MEEIDRSALVQYSAQQMFDLVNDIEKYPLFMSGCVDAKVISRQEKELTGELFLAKAGIKQRLITRNTMCPPQRIDMGLVEGNLKNFSATWKFDSLGSDACKISLSMRFEFGSGLLNAGANKLFTGSANSLVDAVLKRAREVYG